MSAESSQQHWGGGGWQMQTGLGPWVLLKVTSACWEWNSRARLFQQAP